MKKSFILLFLCFSISVCFAQFPNGLMGIQVGFNQMQVDSVIATFQKVKVNTDRPSTIEISGKLMYEEIKWNKLRVRMYGGKVSEIQLEKKSKMTTFSKEAMGLMKLYSERYANYYDDLKTNQDICFESVLKFNNRDNRELRVSYYICSGASLYLTCSRYYNYKR